MYLCPLDFLEEVRHYTQKAVFDIRWQFSIIDILSPESEFRALDGKISDGEHFRVLCQSVLLGELLNNLRLKRKKSAHAGET